MIAEKARFAVVFITAKNVPAFFALYFLYRFILAWQFINKG